MNGLLRTGLLKHERHTEYDFLRDSQYWWSRKKSYLPCFVIPAEAGIQLFQYVLGSRLRGSDDTLTFYEAIKDDGLVKNPQSGHCERSEAISYFVSV